MAKYPETVSKVGQPNGDKIPTTKKPQGQPSGIKGIESTYGNRG